VLVLSLIGIVVLLLLAPNTAGTVSRGPISVFSHVETQEEFVSGYCMIAVMMQAVIV
jgi:hypothetical protein